ncbi:MAG: peptide chain release factor N(5)-glutamine methyltransferase [Gammaproteobacteria bacterium]|nr:peptide chain release factor N(5)-glutamine methyltransferase [Gammaproteobacteria bacterium]
MKPLRRLLDGASGERRRDLEVLLCHVLGKSRAWLYSHGDEALPGVAARQLDTLLPRLSAGEPVAYLIGHKEFWGLPLFVSDAVLIPRPETELLVELALNRLPHRGTVLDLGTGSGAIAIAMRSERSDCQVTACDVSAAALSIARANAQRHTLDITFCEGDWCSGLASFDLILSNPPYISADDPHLPDLRFEPSLALIAGVDGLDAIRRITAQAPSHLNAKGHLIIEHGFDQGPAVRALFVAAGLRGLPRSPIWRGASVLRSARNERRSTASLQSSDHVAADRCGGSAAPARCARTDRGARWTRLARCVVSRSRRCGPAGTRR